MTIENLDFLKEEVLVTELKQAEGKDNPFANTVLPQEKSKYALYKVVKIGRKQENVKVGDKVLISQQAVMNNTIDIKGYGTIEGVYKINNSDSIFSIYA